MSGQYIANELLGNMLTIIIPTFNEEARLPLLLSSITSQDLDGYEVIVADAGSKDRTLEVARRYGCQVISGGSPARGRNQGARVALGDLLLFLDADIMLAENFLSRAVEEFELKGIDAGSFCLEPQGGTRVMKFLFNLFYNWPILLCQPVLPHGTQAILVRRAIHEKLGGFDEEIKLGEDHDYMRRAGAIGEFGILRSGKILSSSRRFERDGWVTTSLKYLLAELHMILLGSVKSDVFKYRFGHYTGNGKKLD